MPRPRQVELNEATRRQIKDTARQLMAEKGTAGLSLRAIARQMDMTAPALYHYFGSLDDLITALIVDAFTSYAAYVRQARDDAAGDSYTAQILAAMLAYRGWALANRTDFQLIYGNPIPGYSAPAEVTTPAAQSIGEVFMAPLAAGIAAGEFDLPATYTTAPPSVHAHYTTTYAMDDATAAIFHLMNQVWSLIHGMVALEIYNHLPPVVGDTETFYREAVRAHLRMLGVL